MRRLRRTISTSRAKNCGRATQDSFTKHSLPVLARRKSVSEPIRLRDGTLKDIEDAYLVFAALPNAHIHASMWSFFQRAKMAADGIVWNQNKEGMAEFALSSAHTIIPMVFESQNDFFNLGLKEQIEERWRDWQNIIDPVSSGGLRPRLGWLSAM